MELNHFCLLVFSLLTKWIRKKYSKSEIRVITAMGLTVIVIVEVAMVVIVMVVVIVVVMVVLPKC